MKYCNTKEPVWQSDQEVNVKLQQKTFCIGMWSVPRAKGQEVTASHPISQCNRHRVVSGGGFLSCFFTFMVPIGVVGIVIPSAQINRRAGAEVEGHMHKGHPQHTHMHRTHARTHTIIPCDDKVGKKTDTQQRVKMQQGGNSITSSITWLTR